MIDLDEMREYIEAQDMDKGGPAEGRRLVARCAHVQCRPPDMCSADPRPAVRWAHAAPRRAWADPAFKARLLADGKAAMAELGINGTGQSADLVVVGAPLPQP